MKGLRSLPRTLFAITGLWVSLLLGASLIWPVGYGFDEPAHVSMAYTYSAQPFHWYDPGKLHYAQAIPNFVTKWAPLISPTSRPAVSPIPPRSARPTLDQLGGVTAGTSTAPNQMDEHPPLYYYLEALVLHIPGVKNLSADLVIWLMRLVSVAIMAPVPILCWDAARRLLARSWVDAEREALLAAAFPLTIPDLVRDGAAVNNDTLLILATSVVLARLARVIRGDRSFRTAAYLAVALAVALWTKGFALMLPLVILLAYLSASRGRESSGEQRPKLWRPLAVVTVGALVGSVWWIRNLILYGTVQTNGYGTAYAATLPKTTAHGGGLLPFLGPYFGGLFSRAWGQVGIPADTPSPGPVVIYGWAVLTAIGLLMVLVVPGGRRARAQAWALTVSVLALIAIDFDGSFSTWRTFHAVRGNQGRYLYSAVVSVAALVTTGYARVLLSKVMRWATPAVLVGAVATNAWVWILILRSEYQPSTNVPFFTGLGKAVDNVLRWSPVPDRLTILLVVVLPLLAAIAAIAVSIWDASEDLNASAVQDPGPPAALASVTR